MREEASTAEFRIRVNAAAFVHTMRGGIGASWHAMANEIPLENERYDYPVRFQNPRGSAFGGNPPVSEESTWEQICRHASWLGLDFIRVELSQRMYEPERAVFDWKNEEMLALYRILDWCESNHADVFLQQMWGHVEWNAFPGVHPLLSAPRSLDDFAAGITALLDYLLRERKYTCIKYFCITNEPPGGTWGYWWSFGQGSGTLAPALKKVREHLDAAGINVPLSGPDWTSLPPLNPEQIDFDESIGAYDIHSYFGVDADGEKIIRDWVQWAHVRKKPFFLTEFGNMNLGWGGENPGPKSFEAALSNASDLICCLNQGTDGMNRWSFVNRGDMDGQWQLIHTWDRKKNSYLKHIEPEGPAYYGFAIMSRFRGKYGTIIQTSAEPASPELRTAALVNRTGELTVFLLNNGGSTKTVSVTIEGRDTGGDLYLYQVTKELVSDADFHLEPIETHQEAGGHRSITLPGKSISVLTDYHLTSQDPGIIL
ncbi:MAG: cellulase family glycosylhydrolase [Bacteroidota bacterium]